ncbi:MAG TPA: alpha/beta hydrolase [Methylomirabilota bacterium]|nr:alpha/beta hydrolase [Methylomirabilota bacterium]
MAPALVSVLAFLSGCGTALERGLIYHPSTTIEGTPAGLGLAFEDVEAVTADGVQIHGWLVPGPRPATLLYCHGNAGNVSHRLQKIAALHNRLGLSILIFDYRGYGRSQGVPGEQGTYADARAMRAWIAGRGSGPVVYLGASLGAAVATALAAEDAPAALVLEAPFASVQAMASATLPGAGWLFRTRYDTRGTIGRVRAPLLVLHGDADEVVPHRQGRAVFDAAAEPKVFAAMPGAHHNDVLEVGGEAYWRAWTAFLAAHLAGW